MSDSDHSLPSQQSVEFAHSPDGLPLILLQGAFGTARFSAQGAHLIDFTPRDGSPYLFLSKRSQLTEGKAIRGGIPVIFPWFGPRANHPESPMHGLVRTRPWTVQKIDVPPAGPAHIEFKFTSSEETLSLWPHAFELTLSFQLGAALEVRWEVRNTGSTSFAFEQALHPYFPVSDIRSATVSGLNGAVYIDKTDLLQQKQDTAATVSFQGETDRLYLDTTAPCVVQDAASGRRLTITKTGFNSSVVWNPWIAKAAALPDMEDDEWEKFVCVEQANAAGNAITLQPACSHFSTALYDFSNSGPR